MSPKIVVKFGGSNLKKSSDFKNLVRVVRAYNQPVVIVVSAFYGITNYLIEFMAKAKDDATHIKALTEFITGLKTEIINGNIQDESFKNQTLKLIESRLRELEKYLLGINCIGDVPDFVGDIVLSYGERLSSLLLNAILQYNNIDSEEILPEELGLITDGEFGNATVDFSLSETRVKQRLSDSKVYVVPGFYGISQSGKVTLFGRGGSDYSAAAIARCIGADSLDFWKDVDGLQSADPKVINNPVSIHQLHYDEAAEMAYFGAKILHPRTVEPLIEKEIPIKIYNIYVQNDTLTPVTVINSKSEQKEGVIKSVTSSDDFGILQLEGAGLGIKPGILARVTTALDDAGINIKSAITSQTTINFLLSESDLTKALEITERLHLAAVTHVNPINQLSTIAVVGAGINEKHSIAARLFGALAKKEINVKIISFGASYVVAYFIVAKQDKNEAILAIHDEFFQKK